MNIKAAINNIYKLGASMRVQGEAQPKPGAAVKSPSAHEKMDTITISTQGSKQKDAAIISSQVMNEIRSEDSSERIEQIKNAIKSGEYNVSAHQVADAILSRIN